MANVLSRLRGRGGVIERSDGFYFNGQFFPHQPPIPTTSMRGSPDETSTVDFPNTVTSIGSRSSVVSAAVTARSLAMSQLVFKFRDRRDTSRLFGTDALVPFERPGVDVTRESLLTRVEPDVAYHGNAYWRRVDGNRLRRLRPDWVSIVVGSNERPDPAEARMASDAEVIGYVYKPGGQGSRIRGQLLGLDEVAHWAPDPHPLASFIGEAWVSAVWREVAADMQATDHVSKFFDNAATANMVATAPPQVTTPEQFEQWVGAFDEAHRGAVNAWRTIYVQSGTDIKVVGSELGKLAMADLQGGFETRVSAKSRVPATVLLIREGLSGSALNAGNYAQTRRMWADSWFAPYAQGFCASMSRLIDVPAGAELTYDPSRILMLQEDADQAAAIRQKDASTIRTLVDSGWEPDAAVEYVRAGGDFRRLLGGHTGMPSVQVQKAAAVPPQEAP